MTDLSWIVEARKHIGLREVRGAGNNPLILSWLKTLKAWWANDSTPWCGVFTAECLRVAQRALPKHWYRASDYLNWGTRLDAPCYGCVVVFTREGGGHVGFVVGEDKRGNLMVLGGNQSDAVSIKPFSLGRVSGYRWPPSLKGTPMSPSVGRYKLPLLQSDGRLSSNEA
jgi:uncharacterized protein (TIGR02594 family)